MTSKIKFLLDFSEELTPEQIRDLGNELMNAARNHKLRHMITDTRPSVADELKSFNKEKDEN